MIRPQPHILATAHRSAGWHGDMESAPRSHIPTPPEATTDECPTKRHSNTLAGTKDRSGHEQTSALDLLTFASHPIVPVHEGTLGIVPPGPDVQLEECRDVEAIRGVDKIEDLPLENRRSVVIVGEPATPSPG